MALKTTPRRQPATVSAVPGQPALIEPRTEPTAAEKPAAPKALERVTPQKIAGIVGEVAHPAAHVGHRPMPRVVKAGGVPEKNFIEGIKVRELLNSAQSPDVSVTIATVAPGMRTALHALDVDEHQLVVSGRGKVQLGDGSSIDGGLIEVGPGDLIVIPKGTPQRVTNIGDTPLQLSCICTPRFTEAGYHHLEDPVAVGGVQAAKPRGDIVAVVPEFGLARSEAHKGKVALVTGGNRGIGLEASRQLAMQGFTVVLTGRDAAAVEAAVKQLQDEGLDVVGRTLDTTKADQAQAVAGFVESTYGRLDALVNAAGINLETDPTGKEGGGILSLDPDVVRRSMEVNTYGPLTVTRALLGSLRKSPDGARVINLSSDMARLSTMGDGFPAYRMSKTALNAQTRELASALESERIAVNAVSPGWVKTRMGGDMAPDTPTQGIQAILWLATAEQPPTGEFFRRVSDQPPPPGNVEIERVSW